MVATGTAAELAVPSGRILKEEAVSPPPPSQNEMVTLVNEMIVTAAANAAAAAAVGQLQRHHHHHPPPPPPPSQTQQSSATTSTSSIQACFSRFDLHGLVISKVVSQFVAINILTSWCNDSLLDPGSKHKSLGKTYSILLSITCIFILFIKMIPAPAVQSFP